MSAEMDAARKRSDAEAPPVAELPRIEPLLPEQALIIREIAGLYPWAPMSNSSGQLSRILPPAVNYLVGYTATKDPPPGSLRRIVAVGVTQLPNADWARYRVKYPLMNVAIDSPQSL